MIKRCDVNVGGIADDKHHAQELVATNSAIKYGIGLILVYLAK
jgi:hypothetical protein